MGDTSKLAEVQVGELLQRIVEAMYPGRDPHAAWSPETVDEVASILADAGLVPDDRPNTSDEKVDREN